MVLHEMTSVSANSDSSVLKSGSGGRSRCCLIVLGGLLFGSDGGQVNNLHAKHFPHAQPAHMTEMGIRELGKVYYTWD